MTAMQRIEDAIQRPITLFMKGAPNMPRCGFSAKVVEILKQNNAADFHHVDVLSDPELREEIKTFANWPTFPQLWVNGELIGGADIVSELHERGELQGLLNVTA